MVGGKTEGAGRAGAWARQGARGLQAEIGVLGEGMGPSLGEGVVWGGAGAQMCGRLL